MLAVHVPPVHPLTQRLEQCGGGGVGLRYRDFKVYDFLCEGRHVIGKTKRVFSGMLSCKHEISLSFLLAVNYDFLLRILDFIVNIERPARLDLHRKHSAKRKIGGRSDWEAEFGSRGRGLYGKVEGYFFVYFVDPGVETCLFVRVNFVG